jgi:ADP-heptose:LPS heptosyltransferase
MGLTKVEFHSGLALGDSLMLTCAVRDLKAAYPDRYLINVQSTAMRIWDYNPNISHFDDPDMVIALGPKKFINGSQTRGLHFANAFRESMENNLNISIPQGKIKPDIYLSDDEKKDKIIDGRYWLLVAGWKNDFTAKAWPPEWWVEVIKGLPEITFVQLGEAKHNHPIFKGPNVINMIGETEDPLTGIRDLFKLYYHCDGSLGLVSMQMHMAAAFDKACVTVAGAREPVSFERYNHHQYLCNQNVAIAHEQTKKGVKRVHLCTYIGTKIPSDYRKHKLLCPDYKPIDPGKIPIKSCWKSKIQGCPRRELIGDTEYAKCLLSIKPEDVIRAVRSYYEGGALQYPEKKATKMQKVPQPKVPQQSLQPFPMPSDNKPIFKMVCNAHAYIGGERSCAYIMNRMVEKGYHVQMVPTKGVCNEFKEKIPDVEITQHLTAPCDILMIYANDMIWGFNKPPYPDLMPKLQADKKILMLNFKLGAAGKAEWTKHWDLYGFLCSQMRDEFLKRVPGANCFVLPPAVDIEPFLQVKVNYNRTFHLVRHSSQGDAKHPADTADMIRKIRELRPRAEFSFMPGPTFMGPIPKVYCYEKNEMKVEDFLFGGTCFWYRLPEGYSDQGPRTIIEAMAVGLPVMADNRWGAKDRVTPETGWLCDNEEDYLSAAIEANVNTLAHKGQAAKERARDKFNPHNWIRTIIER